MPERTSFLRYLHSWFSAAMVGAWEVFGTVSSVAGGALWAWHKYQPNSFNLAVSRIGFSPDGAMNDLVWEIPFTAGVAVLAVRFLRAPYEIHRSNEKVNTERIQGLEAQIQTLTTGPRLHLREPGAVHLVHDVSFFDGTGAELLRVDGVRVRFVNDPIQPVATAVARDVGARISVRRSNGEVIREIDARWSDSPQPLPLQSIVHLLRVDFGIQEEPRSTWS
jgi:hypothetical protein